MTSSRPNRGQPAPIAKTDPEALVLQAVLQRLANPCWNLVQRLVHRRGVAWLEGFRRETLPSSVEPADLLWFDQVLEVQGLVIEHHHHQEDLHHENDHATERRAREAVDAALASMLHECPRSTFSSYRLPPPVMEIPAVPPVPSVLPTSSSWPVFSLGGVWPEAAAEYANDAGLAKLCHQDPVPELINDECMSHQASGFFNSTAHAGETEDDNTPRPYPAMPQAATQEDKASELLPQQLFGRLWVLSDSTRSSLRTLREAVINRVSMLLSSAQRQQEDDLLNCSTMSQAEPRVADSLLTALNCPEWPFNDSEDGSASSSCLLVEAEKHNLTAVTRLKTRGEFAQQPCEAAPAPQALDDLRAWLPEDSLPHAC